MVAEAEEGQRVGLHWEWPGEGFPTKGPHRAEIEKEWVSGIGEWGTVLPSVAVGGYLGDEGSKDTGDMRRFGRQANMSSS